VRRSTLLGEVNVVVVEFFSKAKVNQNHAASVLLQHDVFQLEVQVENVVVVAVINSFEELANDVAVNALVELVPLVQEGQKVLAANVFEHLKDVSGVGHHFVELSDTRMSKRRKLEKTGRERIFWYLPS
jgi:5,10-methylene-tetrahydrofolate dehydrogenase/methenyl tetrahydrofolate cyclohydrolase